MNIDASLSAIVTGGASGLGLATVKALRAAGAAIHHVHASENDRSTPGAGQVHKEQPFVARLPGQFHPRSDDVAVLFLKPKALYFFNHAGGNILN